VVLRNVRGITNSQPILVTNTFISVAFAGVYAGSGANISDSESGRECEPLKKISFRPLSNLHDAGEKITNAIRMGRPETSPPFGKFNQLNLEYVLPSLIFMGAGEG
jgi:hypothetical protein